MSRNLTAALMAAAMSLAVFSCGSSSNTLSQTELVAKADAICKRANAVREAERAGTNYAATVRSEQQALAELTKLIPPSTLAADWHQLLSDDNTLVKDTATFANFIQTHDPRGAHATIVAATNLQHTLGVLATRDGFKDCAQFA